MIGTIREVRVTRMKAMTVGELPRKGRRAGVLGGPYSHAITADDLPRAPSPLSSRNSRAPAAPQELPDRHLNYLNHLRDHLRCLWPIFDDYVFRCLQVWQTCCTLLISATHPSNHVQVRFLNNDSGICSESEFLNAFGRQSGKFPQLAIHYVSLEFFAILAKDHTFHPNWESIIFR